MIYADWRLHDLILNRSENRLLVPAVEGATLLLRRYRYAYISDYERATEEHLAIIDGIRRKDEVGVTSILKEHLRLRPMS